MTRGGRAGDEGGSEVVVGDGDDSGGSDWVEGSDDGDMEQGMAMELPSGTERTAGEGMSTWSLGAWSGRVREEKKGGGEVTQFNLTREQI